MGRILVISDIHGEITMFEQLLEKANYDSERDQLILLGDYIDRGPDSPGVLDKVIRLKEAGAIVLRGNHDQMMVDAYEEKTNAWMRWIKNGGIETLVNYDPSITEKEFPKTDRFKEHIDFIRSLDYYHETDEYIFVHAGLDPDLSLEDTDPNILIWIRDKFHQGYKGDKTVVFGHTPTPLLHKDDKNYDIYYGPNKIIGIDGAAVYGGQLNCLDVTSGDVYAVKAK